MKGKVALHNLGCKVNAYETEAMQQMLEAAGYEIVPFEPGADIYVINTCSVTNIADRKSRQMLHRARKMNPDAVVVAAGCYVQAKEKEIQEGLAKVARQRGIIEEQAPGLYDLRATTRRYISYLRSGSLADERAGLTRAKREAAENIIRTYQ